MGDQNIPPDENEEEALGVRAMRALLELRNTGQLLDGTLSTEDGGSIKVHRAVMVSCSPYFKALFTSSLNNNDRFHVTIPGISHDMLKLVVDYAYTRTTGVTMENVGQLLPAADQFNVLGMIRDCCSFVLGHMNAENCIGIRKFGNLYNCNDLEKEAHRYLMKNFIDVAAKSQELLELPLEEVMLIFNSEDLNISNEEIAWEAVVKWIDHDPENRSQSIVELMHCVRLGLLDQTYFMEKVKAHPYVANNEQCKPIVIETLKFLCDLGMITEQTGEIPTPMLARPRVPHEIMFAVGGWSGGSPTNIIETYDTRADRWIPVPEVDPSGPRAYHKCAVVGFDIFIIGGFDGIEYYNSCRGFNAVSKEWREIAPMHCRRCYVSVAVIGQVIYAMGGYNGHHRQNTAEKYDLSKNQWTFIAPMNAQRSDACATTLNGLVYVTGGFNGTECLNSCEFYNPETNQWVAIAAMRNRRSGVSCIAHHGQLFALGGFNGISRLAGGEKYNPAENTWAAIPDMYNPRSNFAIEVVDDLVFVVGGFNGVTTISNVECYNVHSERWSEGTNMNIFRSALAACVVEELPNVRDYVVKNRDNLLEEKRQRLRDLQLAHRDNLHMNAMSSDDDDDDGDTDDDVEMLNMEDPE